MVDASPEVENSLRAIAVSQLAVTKTENALAHATRVLHARSDQLKKQVAGGSTTGDPFRDRFIKLYGWEPVAELAYRDINEQLAGRKGEFALLVYSHEVSVPGGFLREESYRAARYCRLGVLDDETLGTTVAKGFYPQHDSVVFCLPVSRYIERETEPYPTIGRLEVIGGNLFDQRYMHRDPPVFSTYMLEKAGLWKESGSRSLHAFDVELIVGDEATKAWLAKVAMESLYKPAAAALSKLILEQTDAA